ncbi:ATP-binding protein [Pollutibacter soli]|uniref:sensor histidine kinase n=1 Tax=Pollutibacter soli TaxID=3034157 RepID=UPI003013695E
MTTVKTKIRAGTIFLFLLLLVSGGVGIYYLVKLKKDAKAILANNYESIDYCQQLLAAFDSSVVSQAETKSVIISILEKQKRNITEPGEDELTAGLENAVKNLFQGDSSETLRKSIRHQLLDLIRLNMSAIETKNRKAEATAETALTYLTVIATIIFIIAITFAYNFPFIITNPIRKLTEAIQQIEQKNYRHRLHIDQHDEFGKMADAYNSMAARLEYFENSNLNRILFEKSRAEAVINSLKDASIGIDKKEQILFANEQALALLGLASEDIVGHSVNELKSRNDLFRFLIDDKKQSPFKIVVSNRENYFTKEIIDIQQKDGQGNRMIIIKNITSFKELDVAKTNFIATISHELKTPLASSDFGLKLLEDTRVGQLTGEQQQIVKHLKEDNQRMLRILSEMLNISQVEAGRIDMRIEPTKVQDAIAEAVQTVEKPAEEKQITLEVDVDENIPVFQADKQKLVWVLNNLLTNAIKFSPEKTTVTISAQQADGALNVSVADQGPGIESQYHDYIFTKYFRVPGSKSSGNGLGLSISKDVIEAMKGNISVESEQGKGSTFTINLPLS